MSAARDYLADLDRHGVRLEPKGEGLRLVSPAGQTIPTDLIERGRALKPALLALLREPFGQNVHTVASRHSGDMGDADVAEAFEERAAIAEHDGGLPRAHAELVALTCTVPLGPSETLETRDAVVIHLASYLDMLRNRRAASRNGGSAA